MKQFLAGLAIATALLGPTLAGTALAQDYNSQRDHESRRDQESNRSDWGRGRDRFARLDLEGRWVAENRSADFGNGGDFRGRGWMHGMTLPEVIRIDQRPSMVRISYFKNQLIQEVMIGGRFDPREGGRPDRNDFMTGHWRGSTLVVESTGTRGAAITQTFALENSGRTLVVRTRREGPHSSRSVEFTNVYRKA